MSSFVQLSVYSMDFKTPLQSNQKAKIPLHEWMIVLLFCLILLLLAGFALSRPKPPPRILSSLSASEKITVLEVKVEGEVTKPGQYRLPLHSTLKDLFEQVEPLPSADLSQISWRRRLHHNQTIRIPKRQTITIQVTGAVEHPGTFEILSGTRYFELADQLAYLPDADLKAIRRRRGFIQSGQCIDVPFQKKIVNKKLKKQFNK